MKRYKRLYLLLGVLAVACIATFGVLRFEEHQEQIKNSDEIILKVPSDTVTSLSWEYQEESLSFHKEEVWLYDEDEAFPVSEEKINGLLAQFEEFGASFIIENVQDYGQYGLDVPVCTIRFSTDEQEYEVQLGDYSSMDSERYVSIGDGNVYLVQNDPLDQFDAVLSDMIDHDDVPRFDAVASIQFSGDETYSIVYEEGSDNTYCADDVYFAQIGGEMLPLDTERVQSYLDSITDAVLTDYVTYNATEEELQSYGLDSPELTISVNYTSEDEDGESFSDAFVLNISRAPDEKTAAEADETTEAESSVEKGETDSKEEEITAYARVGESQIVYQISAADYKALTAAAYNSLRHLEVLSADFADIEQIDISLDGAEYTIASEKKGNDRTYFYGEEELDIAMFQSALEGLVAESFTSEQPSQQEEIGLTVYLDNENHPEVQIKLYRYDGSHCLADGLGIGAVFEDVGHGILLVERRDGIPRRFQIGIVVGVDRERDARRGVDVADDVGELGHAERGVRRGVLARIVRAVTVVGRLADAHGRDQPEARPDVAVQLDVEIGVDVHAVVVRRGTDLVDVVLAGVPQEGEVAHQIVAAARRNVGLGVIHRILEHHVAEIDARMPHVVGIVLGIGRHVVARITEGHLREVVGAEREEVGHFGDLVRGDGCARNLDHRTHGVVDNHVVFGEHLLRHSVDHGFLCAQLAVRTYQRNHNLDVYVDTFFLDV